MDGKQGESSYSIEKSKLLTWRLQFNKLTIVETIDLTQRTFQLDKDA